VKVLQKTTKLIKRIAFFNYIKYLSKVIIIIKAFLLIPTTITLNKFIYRPRFLLKNETTDNFREGFTKNHQTYRENYFLQLQKISFQSNYYYKKPPNLPRELLSSTPEKILPKLLLLQKMFYLYQEQ
jgi:hypothetical protein